MQTSIFQPTRRGLLRLGQRASMAAFAAGFAKRGLISDAHAAGVSWPTLLIIKLDGGNDSLNTVVPYTDPLYYKYRPTIGLSGSSILPLNATYAFNSVLAPLVSGSTSPWIMGEMAVILGVGFQQFAGSGSHFSASDVWGTAAPSFDNAPDGWITRLLNTLPAQSRPTDPVADAVLTQGVKPESVAGKGIRTVVSPPNGPVHASIENSNVAARAAANPTYAWVLGQQTVVDNVAPQFSAVNAVSLMTTFPASDIGAQLATAARVIASGVGVPVIVANQSTYDTHYSQVTRQTSLLSQLAQAIAAFRTEMQLRSLWNNVLVMTYSEFSRSVVENSAVGTDHGMAGTQFILGGRVKGGVIGSQSALSTVPVNQGGLLGLQYQTDFRQVYASVMQDWWGISRAVSDSVISDKGLFPVSFPSLGLLR